MGPASNYHIKNKDIWKHHVPQKKGGKKIKSNNDKLKDKFK